MMKALLIALAGLAAARTTQPQEGVPHTLEPLFAPLVSDGSDRTERSAQGGCSGETSGPCKSADGVCWEYQDVWGKLLCPGAAEECGNINASPPPSPLPKAFTKCANGPDATCVITASQDLTLLGCEKEGPAWSGEHYDRYSRGGHTNKNSVQRA